MAIETKWKLVLSLAVVVMLCGCGTIGETVSRATGMGGVDESSLTPAERRMRDRNRAYQKTVWQNVLAGAGIGAAVQVIRGKRGAKDVAMGALAGASVGALAGAYLAEKEKGFANAEDRKKAMIADTKALNKKLKKDIADSREVLREDKRQLAAVKRELKAGSATQADLDAALARSKERKRYLSSTLDANRKSYGAFKDSEKKFRTENPGINTREWQRALKRTDSGLSKMNGIINAAAV